MYVSNTDVVGTIVSVHIFYLVFLILGAVFQVLLAVLASSASISEGWGYIKC